MIAFLALMLVKVSALHIYSHEDFEEDTVEKCAFCDLAIENQNAEMLFDNATEVAFQQLFSFEDSPLPLKQDIFSTTEENLYLFLRPPPTA